MRKKGLKQTEVRRLPNVFLGAEADLTNKIKNYFGNQNPLTLEIGCGNGEYTTTLALKFPERNFVGLDLKGSRIWTGAKKVINNKIKNAAFIISYAERIITVFDRLNVEEIWLPFPNPFERIGSIKQRLVHPRFLEMYKRILVPGGKINLKTDDNTLYKYTRRVISENKLTLNKFSEDLHSSGISEFEEQILTKYEKEHLLNGKKIRFVSFSFNKNDLIIPVSDDTDWVKELKNKTITRD